MSQIDPTTIIDILCDADIEEDADGEYLPEGGVRDLTTYTITLSPSVFADLVDALGIVVPFAGSPYEYLMKEIKRRNNAEFQA